jgi:hypothetical protein
MPGQVAGDGTFACPSRPINRHDHLPARFIGPEKVLLRAHPRFFVFRPAFFRALGLALFFAGAVKP